MKRWWQKYQAWKLRQTEHKVQKWAHERLEGQARFVLRTMLLVSMSILTLNEIFNKNIGLGTIIFWHGAGLILGFYQWMDNETKYELALSQGRVNAAVPPGKPPRRLNKQ